MKHTPGPWDFEDYDVTAADGSVICHVNCTDDFPCIGEDNDDVQMAALVAELEANARLIAAAPDLYEACKEMMIRLTEMFNRHERPTYARNADSDLELILASGKAAIAKAEGESK